MEIRPATIEQVRLGRDGQRIRVEDDVGSIAKQIQEISPRLKLEWNWKGEFFMVIETADTPDGLEERLVTTCRELDGRLLQRVREITSPSYSFLDEVERIDLEAERDKDRRFSERVGEAGEHAAHALRKDVGATNKAFVSKDV
jgi:hypothetical protein